MRILYVNPYVKQYRSKLINLNLGPMLWFVPLQRQEVFSSNPCVQTGSGAHPGSCTMGTGGPFTGAKARPGRDAGHSPPSSAVVMKE
jgi:hypothetical protein